MGCSAPADNGGDRKSDQFTREVTDLTRSQHASTSLVKEVDADLARAVQRADRDGAHRTAASERQFRSQRVLSSSFTTRAATTTNHRAAASIGQRHDREPSLAGEGSSDLTRNQRRSFGHTWPSSDSIGLDGAYRGRAVVGLIEQRIAERTRRAAELIERRSCRTNQPRDTGVTGDDARRDTATTATTATTRAARGSTTTRAPPSPRAATTRRREELDRLTCGYYEHHGGWAGSPSPNDAKPPPQQLPSIPGTFSQVHKRLG
ncbi:hypothetical protein BH23ACT2_BH23ACT2_18420 [soil metagenome]